MGVWDLSLHQPHVGKLGSALSLVLAILYIRNWLPTAPPPVVPGPTRSLRLGCVGGGPGPGVPGGAIHIVQRGQSAECVRVTVQSLRIRVPTILCSTPSTLCRDGSIIAYPGPYYPV